MGGGGVGAVGVFEKCGPGGAEHLVFEVLSFLLKKKYLLLLTINFV